MAQHRAEDRGRHDSGKTSSNPRSGDGGKHSKDTPTPTNPDKLISHMRPGVRRSGGNR